LRNRLTYLSEDSRITDKFTTAVSLHGHTNRSRESLYFIAEFMSRYALLRVAMTRLEHRALREGSIKPNLAQGFWTPPLPPLEAFTVERKQIEDGLGMNSLISLTDHDTIEAPLLLRVVPEARRIPVSLEWSIHFANTVFHLGVHNLPTAEAEIWVKRMNAYTERPNQNELWELLYALVRIPQVLLVFNHPLWDLPNIGKANHIRAVRDFLGYANPFFHAFELGGLRSWKENRDVIELAKAYKHPVIAGGDRHGCEPSALLNVTNATSFSEFVQEVRQQHSHVLAMPQYSDSTTLRVFHTVLDVVRTYPDHPIGSRAWDERVFHPDKNGVVRPLAALWRGGPPWMKNVFHVLHAVDAEPYRGTLSRALNRGPQMPRLELEDVQEVGL
jgi:hypothetical protein